MRHLLWNWIERRLRRAVPPAQAVSAIGDLAEEYARRRQRTGAARANAWLLKEGFRIAKSPDLHVSTSQGPFMLFDELRHASRRLRSRPLSPLLCAGLLAAGIGLTTAVFSVVDSILWRPAPFPHADRLVQDAGASRPIGLIQAWRDTGLFERIETWDTETLRLTTATEPMLVQIAEVSAGVFEALGVRTLRGRVLTEADEHAGGVIVLSERLWRSAFGADPEIIGRRVAFHNVDLTVVGIAAGSFRFPEPSTLAWTPLSEAGAAAKGSVNTLARIRPGIPIGDVEARMTELARRASGANAKPIALRPIEHMPIGAFVRGALPLLLGGVVAVFLVLCANVSGLLLTGLSARQRELSICTALGAGRRRLLLETMIEHGLIGAAGIAAGLLLAYGLISSVPLVFVDRTLNPIDLDPRALAAACGLGIAAVLLGGLWPAWIGTRRDPVEAVRGPSAPVESRTARATSRALLVGQIALAAALLVGSTVLVRTFVNLIAADRGLDVTGVLRTQIVLLDAAIDATRNDRSRREEVAAAMTAAIQDRLKGWPQIESVALSRRVPPESAITAQPAVMVRSDVPGAVAVPIAVQEYGVTPAFFEVYRIPVIRGGFTTASGPLDVVVGERFAAMLWPGGDPIGRTFSREKEPAPFRVVGVAREIMLPTLDAAMDRPEYYRLLQSAGWTPYLSVRCRAACPDPAAIAALVREVHPKIDLSRMFGEADADYLNHLRLPRAMAELGGLFTIVAVLTAAGGLFSVMTRTVSRRHREFGIRSALGASPARMKSVVYREALTLAASGIIAGVAAGWAVAKALTTFQYGVSPADPLTWAIVIGTIAITSLAAVWRPARQASRVDPVTLLRQE